MDKLNLRAFMPAFAIAALLTLSACATPMQGGMNCCAGMNCCKEKACCKDGCQSCCKDGKCSCCAECGGGKRGCPVPLKGK